VQNRIAWPTARNSMIRTLLTEWHTSEKSDYVLVVSGLDTSQQRSFTKVVCKVPGCSSKHHTMLRERFAQKPQRNRVTSSCAVQTILDELPSKVCNVRGEKIITSLNVVLVRIMAHGKEVKTNAFLDQVSTTTLCDERLVDALGLSGEPVTFSISTLNRVSDQRYGKKVQLDVALINGGDVSTLFALTFDCLDVTKNPSIDAIDLQRWNHLCDLNVPVLHDEDNLLLIGVDVPHAFRTLEERRGNVGEPFAVRTPLGWSLIGPCCLPLVKFWQCTM